MSAAYRGGRTHGRRRPGRAWTRWYPRGVEMTATPSPIMALSTASPARPAAQPARTLSAPRRLAGRYRYDRRAGTWTWSPEMAALLNLARNAAHPCTELLVHSLHPGDRPRALDAIAAACTAGTPFALRVRHGPGGRHVDLVPGEGRAAQPHPQRGAPGHLAAGPRAAPGRPAPGPGRHGRRLHRRHALRPAGAAGQPGRGGAPRPPRRRTGRQIGRASCRERV